LSFEMSYEILNAFFSYFYRHVLVSEKAHYSFKYGKGLVHTLRGRLRSFIFRR